MSGGQGQRVAVSFSTAPGEGFNLMRQALVRMVLAMGHAAVQRRSLAPEDAGELILALAPICATPHVRPGAHPPGGLPWSRLVDLEHFTQGVGMPVTDLGDFVTAHPSAPWRLLQLRLSPRILAMLPGSPPDCWDHREGDPAGFPAPVGCRCRPDDWLNWSSVQPIDAFFSPSSPFLARETLSHPGHGTSGVFLAHAETMNWGSSYGSEGFWRVIAALRPAEGIRDLAARLRPPGPYLGVHWRRGDFRRVHADHSPSPGVAAEQIIAHARTHGLTTVFVATDAAEDEIAALRGPVEAAGLGMMTLAPDSAPELCDLERAALEQAILFESAAFIGTRISTFSHTVFETREAAQSWEPGATWNVLCGDAHHPGNADDTAFGPVEPRRAFKQPAGPEVRFVSADLIQSIPGGWTILPMLPALVEKLDAGVDWVFFAPADLPARHRDIVEWLAQHDPRSGIFLGRALCDIRPTIIHHYRQDQLSYPDFRCGFALSRPLLLRLVEAWRTRTPKASFHIDPAYELADAVRACGIDLTDEPRLAGLIQASPSSHASPVRAGNVVFAVKTHEGNHHSRIPVLQRTWGGDAPHLLFYSDVHDPAIPTIPVGVPNSSRGHGQKFHAIARHLMDHHGEREWFVIVDDDTLLSVSRLLLALGSFSGRRDEPLFVGQRYGYGHDLPGGGYDYITMGGGMAMNRAGLGALLRENEPPPLDTPDDMWVGLCLKKMGIAVIHDEGFHQEPPGAYPPESLAGRRTISFHRHAPDDPDAVFGRYLRG
jgi:UDP-glucose:O-linked fucose beta-1,3-glucosyltransferase